MFLQRRVTVRISQVIVYVSNKAPSMMKMKIEISTVLKAVSGTTLALWTKIS